MGRLHRLATGLGAAAIAIGLATTACSGDTDDKQGGGTAVELTGKFGAASVTGTPQRVVALSTTDADLLFSLGVTPVAIPTLKQTEAMTKGTGIMPWQDGRYPAGTPTLATESATAETVLALRPDLIVATAFFGLTEQVYEQLSTIAPVVHFDTEANADAWQDSVRKVARAVRRDDKAPPAIARAENAVTTARQRYPAFANKTYNAIISPSAATGIYTLCSTVDNLARVMDELGLKISAYAQKVPCDGGKGNVSWENLPHMDADILWVIPDDPQQVAVLDRQALWRSLPAVQRGAIAVVPKTEAIPFSVAFPSPLSLEWGVGRLAPRLDAAARA